MDGLVLVAAERYINPLIHQSNQRLVARQRFGVIFPTMDWQQLVSLAIVGLAAGALLWSRFRPRKFSFQRDTHCGCATSGQAASQQSIVFRARKGERPQVLIKTR